MALPVEALFDAGETVVAGDEVIDQFDVELLAGLEFPLQYLPTSEVLADDGGNK